MRSISGVGWVVSVGLVLGCSDSGSSTEASSGGADMGVVASGGSVGSNTGGTSALGGQNGTQDTPSTGGLFATGGVPATGGQSSTIPPSTGGRSSTIPPSTGGQFSTGGTVHTGGSSTTGDTGTGGVPPVTGGRTGWSTGGVESSGGRSSTGTTGGIENTGGSSDSGTTGGIDNPGGSPSTGGVENSGGIPVSPGGNPGQGGESGVTGGGSSISTGGTESVVCPATVLSPGDSNKTVEVDGQSREYILHVPSAYNGSEPVPLIVDFHPIGGSASGERSSSPYSAQTDPEGVITAYPNGKSGPMGNAWNVEGCCVSGVDDIAFARALVAQVQESACIDPKRIYAVGFSMGGGMSHYTACHAADVFAAVAPAAFDLLEENVGGCTPPRPITVVSFRGTSDPIVPYDGGLSQVVSGMPITFLGAQGTFRKWAEIDGCTGSPSAEDAQGCSTYSDCEGGVEVVLCTKQGGGHDYGNAAVGWPILKRHVMP